MRIVVPDCLGDSAIEACFRRHLDHLPDTQIHCDPPRSDEELGARLSMAECVLLHFEAKRLTSAALARAPHLRVVSIAGVGTGCVDLDAMRARGIRVETTQQATIPAVAEMTIAMMLSLSRDLVALDRSVRNGEWPVRHGFDLDGKTLGLLGLGAIGRHVARIAAAFGMRVVAWSPNLTDSRAIEAGAQYRPLADLMAEADVISTHLRAVPALAGIIDRAVLMRMKSTAIFINTARSSLVDEDALYEMVHLNRIRGVGLDVFATEPLPLEHRWRVLPNVVLTPHTAWRTLDSLDRFVRGALRNALGSK